MTTTVEPEKRLRTAARQAAAGMSAAAKGKPEEAALESDVRTFNGIAQMLEGLSKEVDERDKMIEKLKRMHHRIAELEIRGAAELFEKNDWRKIAGELQAIAQEALNIAEGRPTTKRER
ncbi:hypothetical protein [Sphingomonas sp. ID0503]|uniref:hypothetical protein n=1 Tax=Sphingomonas sp. ID0503 TaxID=3399691 RepID=UPI003AFAC65E